MIPTASQETAPPAGAARIAPEELTALVARLHDTNDALTVGEVAAALNLPEEDVARALGEVRTGAPKLRPAPHRRRRRLLAFSLASLALVGTYAAGPWIFRWAQIRTLPIGRRLESAVPSPMRELTLMPSNAVRRRIEANAPKAVKITVASESYTGENASAVVGTEAIAALREAVELDRSQIYPRDPIFQEAIASQLASLHPHAVPGLDFTRIAVAGSNGPHVVYIPTTPGPRDGPAYHKLETGEIIRAEAARRWNQVADLMTDAMFAPTIRGPR